MMGDSESWEQVKDRSRARCWTLALGFNFHSGPLSQDSSRSSLGSTVPPANLVILGKMSSTSLRRLPTPPLTTEGGVATLGEGGVMPTSHSRRPCSGT